ncbi:MAG TPA: oxidoreductase [Rhodopila sp.]
MQTILITGVSSGLGRAIAIEALARGHRVIGTVRRADQAKAFGLVAPGRSFGRILDVTDHASIAPLVRAIEADFGTPDVLVNNAGYGLRGVVEELDLDALRHQLEVNLTAPVALIQAVLPGMRARRSGHILNMASMGSVTAFPTLGAYHASKFALLGMGDALAQEVARFGIHVTAILPGVYRSDWNGRSQAHADHEIADYDALLAQRPDLPWGDPAALGRVVLEAIAYADPPRHLLVGPTALATVRKRLSEWSAEIDRWEALSYAEGQG